MGARQKLNRSYFTGSVLLAAVAGGIGDSWILFGLALVVLLGLNLAAREIRLKNAVPRSQSPTRDADRRAG